MKKLFCVVASMMLSACGTVDNAIRSDDSIKEKAAFALGTTPANVTISNRKSEIDKVTFNASTNGRVYQCFYTTAGISSSALCSPTDGKPATAAPNCNALLKAAGRC